MVSGEVIFINRKNSISQNTRTDEDRKREFESWFKMKPFYIPTWAWELACRREPCKYKMFLPTYQGKRVMLT